MCDNYEEELITTSQGPEGDQGIQGMPGTNGTNGVLDWSEYDLSCWLAEGILAPEDTENDIITQKFIDSFCAIHQQVNIAPVAVNDYRTMNQDSTIFIEVINNDQYYPDVTVTIAIAPSNGTATIEADNKTIKYIPNAGYVGVDDFDYTIDDGTNTSTATVSVTVEAVISQQTIQDTILEQLTILLQSDDYWDLGFNIGDKIGISNINLVDFDFTNPFTAGIGKVGRYSKWAICNGNNGSEDLTDGTFRGFNHTNADYDESAKAGGSDASQFTLDKGNIPAHVHTYADNETYDAGGGNGTIENAPSIGDWENRTNAFTTGDGVADGLKVSPDEVTIDVRNAFKTVILIQKIS